MIARFVVLEHETPLGSARALHWDFMLEYGAVLRTWALPHPPVAGQPQQAEQIADHRTAYLDYEGPVSGGRGSVTRWDAGQYQLLLESPLEMHFSLQGQKLQGRAILRRDAESDQRWNFSMTDE